LLTSSHGYWALRLSRRRPGWTALGAVGPDLPALTLGALLAARRVPRPELLERLYHRGPGRATNLLAHSLLVPAALATATRRESGRRAVAAGWLGHLAVDYLSHHDDAWPPLWPLSHRRLASPVSYWQPEHHARGWSQVEALALAAAVARDRERPGRRVAGAAAWVVASWPALLRRGNLFGAVGLRPDAQARGRDLAR